MLVYMETIRHELFEFDIFKQEVGDMHWVFNEKVEIMDR